MKYYSNEIVFRSHPDKVCDQISDALLDAYLKEDKNSRCGIETVGGKNKIFITGELTSNAKVNVEKIVKRVSGFNLSSRHIGKRLHEYLKTHHPCLHSRQTIGGRKSLCRVQELDVFHYRQLR